MMLLKDIINKLIEKQKELWELEQNKNPFQETNLHDLQMISDLLNTLFIFMQTPSKPFVISSQPGAGVPIDIEKLRKAGLAGCSKEAHELNQLRKEGVNVLLLNTMTPKEQIFANQNFSTFGIDVAGLTILNDPNGILSEIFISLELLKIQDPKRKAYPAKSMVFAPSCETNGQVHWKMTHELKNELKKPSRDSKDYIISIRKAIIEDQLNNEKIMKNNKQTDALAGAIKSKTY